MKIRLFTSAKNLLTPKNNVNKNINYNQRLTMIQIPSNIIIKKKPTTVDTVDKIIKLIIKRLDRIEQKNKEILRQFRQL